MVLYADTPLIEEKTIKSAINFFNKKSLDLCVLSMKPKLNDHTYGRLFFKNKSLVKIIEKTDMTPNHWKNDQNICNSGMMIFNTKKLIKYIDFIGNSNKKKEYKDSK